MDSSISHFKAGRPARAAGLLAAAAVAWGLCVLFSLKLNPYIHLYVQGAALKDQWAGKMAREHGAKILIYGGSSCAFSIDGERMLNRYNLPTVNYGLAAGFGPVVLTECVLRQCRPGDTLIVALEPELLAKPMGGEPDGIQFSFAMGHPAWVTDPVLKVAPISWFAAITGLRPGGLVTFTYLGKIVCGQPITRYHLTDFHPSGWQQTPVRLAVVGPMEHDPLLSPEACKLLRNLRAWCDRQNVRVAYSLPWSYTPPAKERDFKLSNVDFLLQINRFLPVLKDPCLGANTNSALYADTPWHLTPAGSLLRTDGLAEAIQNWDLWTPAELGAQTSTGMPPEPSSSGRGNENPVMTPPTPPR